MIKMPRKDFYYQKVTLLVKFILSTGTDFCASNFNKYWKKLKYLILHILKLKYSEQANQK